MRIMKGIVAGESQIKNGWEGKENRDHVKRKQENKIENKNKNQDKNRLSINTVRLEVLIECLQVINLAAGHPLVVLGAITDPFHKVLPSATASSTIEDATDQVFLSTICSDDRTRFLVSTTREQTIIIRDEGTEEGGVKCGQNLHTVR